VPSDDDGGAFERRQPRALEDRRAGPLGHGAHEQSTDRLDTFSSDSEARAGVYEGAAAQPMGSQVSDHMATGEQPRAAGDAPVGVEDGGDSSGQQGSIVRRSERVRRAPERFGAGMLSHASSSDPSSFAEAMARADADMWKAAADAEMEALAANDTYNVVVPPPGVRVLPAKWVFTTKRALDGSVERYKARIVVGGHRQVRGVDYEEVYAPVGKFDTLRTILACRARRITTGSCTHSTSVMLS